MKEKRDCKNCGVPLKDWQVKQGYDLCLECYNETKKPNVVKNLLKEEAIQEEEDLVEELLGEDNEHLEDDLENEEED